MGLEMSSNLNGTFNSCNKVKGTVLDSGPNMLMHNLPITKKWREGRHFNKCDVTTTVKLFSKNIRSNHVHLLKLP